MIKIHLPILLLTSLFLIAARPAAAEPPTVPAEAAPRAVDEAAALDRSSPRATMRTFLLAIQEAEHGHPARIDDAVACLDLSRLEEGEGRRERARQLARRLAEVVDALGVNLEDIPEQGVKRLWYFHRQGRGEGPVVALERDREDGGWRFSAATLRSIPELEAGLERAAAEPGDAAVPAARRSPRATMASFLRAMNPERLDWEAAVACLDGSGQEPAAWESVARRRAAELKNVIDKIEYVVLSEIPDAPAGPPYQWYTGEAGNIVLDRLAEGEQQGEWRFSAETVASIEALYKAFEGRPLVAELRARGVGESLTLGMRLERGMPAWLRGEYLGLQGWQWGALGLLLLLGVTIRRIFPGLVRLLAGPLVQRRIAADREVQRRAFDTSGILAALVVAYFALQHLQLPAELLGLLLPVTKLLVTLSLIFAGYRLVDVFGEALIANREVSLTGHDELLFPLLRKVLRLLVFVVVVLFIMEFWFHQPPSTVLGALGIGGIALALAAQSTLSNFFGSLTVLADRPFSIGDWIVIGEVEGTVEHVGFRSTRIRTFYNSLITIPNARLVDSHVDNYGAREYRRFKVMLSLTYDTPPERIDAFCEGVRELIRLHPYTRKDYYHVYLNQFAASSLDILLYMFVRTPDWSTELRERHKLFLDILRLARRLGVEFAFPTQTLWLRQGEGAAAEQAPTPDQAEVVGVAKAAEVYQEIYGPEERPRPPVSIETRPLSRRRPG